MTNTTADQGSQDIAIPAPCADSDPDLFFPDGRADSDRVRRQVAQAKAICAGCPLLAACREYALANPRLTAYGVWGGLSEQDRGELGRTPSRRTVAAQTSGVAA